MGDQVLDYLVIGQGLAGTFFSYELAKNGHNFAVIDAGKKCASHIAAGIYNPVVLKRFTPVWQGQEQIQTAKQTIGELEALLDCQLDYPMDIYRIFHDEGEGNTWQQKAQQQLNALIDAKRYHNIDRRLLAPHGLGRVCLSGRMDISTLLQRYRQHLLSQQRLLSATFHYDRLTFYRAGIRYDDITAKRLVFCEGFQGRQNPYFKNLPLRGSKGELLTVNIPGLRLDSIIKSSVFLLPLAPASNHPFLLGASYDYKCKDSMPTVATRKKLLAQCQAFLSADTAITPIAHQAGIRPTVSDRRPLLGQHPEHPQLYILNGLGTRGIMLGASMAKQLYRSIEQQKPLDDDIDIKRFGRSLLQSSQS